MYCIKPWTKHIFFQKRKFSQKLQQAAAAPAEALAEATLTPASSN